jgi:hypothetical protein
MEISPEALWASLPPCEVTAIKISRVVLEELRAENYLRAGQVEVRWASHYRNQGRL